MNNLVFFNEVVKQKVNRQKLNNSERKANNRYDYRLKQRIERSKAIIQKEINKNNQATTKKINIFESNENIIDLKSKNNKEVNNEFDYKKCEIDINNTLKKLFMLETKTPLINFLNSLYNDNLSLKTKIDYIVDKKDKDSITDDFCKFAIVAKDKNRQFRYEVQFQNENNDQISINVLKYNVETKNGQSIKNGQNINQFFEIGKCHNVYDYKSKTKLPKGYMIIIDSSIEMPDTCIKDFEIYDKNILCEFNIFKGWKYDFKKLYENNMYLLLPLKIFDLRKRLFSIKYQIDILPKIDGELSEQELKLQNLIKDDIMKFFNSFNVYLKKMKQKGLIKNKDIRQLNLISLNLLKYFDSYLKEIITELEDEIKYKRRELYL